jgi:NitT/TauT family transport system permease protein
MVESVRSMLPDVWELVRPRRWALALGLVLIAIAEMVGAKSGLGYMIWNAWETFAVEQMYVGLFVIALIGFALTVLLNAVERLLVPWRA